MTIRRRILLAELTPRVPLPIEFATWNALVNAANITFSGGDLDVTPSAFHATAWNCALCLYVKDYGQWYWETTHTFSGTGDVVAGICNIDFNLLTQPGLAFSPTPPVEYSVAGPDKNGDCRFNGAITASLGALTSGDVVRHWLDLDAGIYRVAVNGGAWVTMTDAIPSGGGYFPVVGFLKPAGSTASCLANFGASAFAYTPPDGARAGFYIGESVATTLYVASEGFDATIGGSPVHFMGRIVGNQDVEVEREASCWVWGNQAISRRGQLVIVNNDGALDDWRDYLWRDAGVLLRELWEGDTYAESEPWAYSRADSIELTRDARIVISLADPLAWTDRPMQPDLYPEDQANLQLAGQPLPIVYGNPLYCTPAKLSTVPAERDHQLHDSTGADALTAIAAVYDSGDQFAGPDDPFTPASIITAANGGNFTGNSGATPPVPLFFNVPTGAGVYGATDFFKCETSPSFGYLHCKSLHAPAVVMEHTGTTLLARTRYRITFNCTSVLSPGSIIFRAPGSPDVSVSLTTTGTKSVALYVRTAAPFQMVLRGDGIDAYIQTLRVDAEQVIDWTYWGTTRGFTLANSPYGKIVANPEGTLSGLEEYIEDIAARVQLPDITIDGVTLPGWDLASALSMQEPDAAYALDAYIDKPTTGLALLRWFMDAWCGCPVSNRLGIVAFRKITEPSATAQLVLDQTNVMGEIVVTSDRAKDLTLRLAGAKNNTVHTDGEIVSGVPEDLATALQTEWGITVEGASSASEPVSSAYAAAISAPAKGLPIRLREHLQALANRIATLWRPTRNFYQLTAILDATDADELEPGDTVQLVWPRWGLDAGKNLLVVGVRSRFFSRRVELKLWG